MIKATKLVIGWLSVGLAAQTRGYQLRKAVEVLRLLVNLTLYHIELRELRVLFQGSLQY